MLNNEERLLWEAEASLQDAIDQLGRDKVIDYLDHHLREDLFKGYVLQEHYNCLKNKYDILKMSHSLQHDAVMSTVYAGKC